MNILWLVDPLLCDDREIGKYTRSVSGQRLSKHVPVAKQQILNNATVGLQQWNICNFDFDLEFRFVSSVRDLSTEAEA
jgi:hypothetical protein